MILTETHYNQLSDEDQQEQVKALCVHGSEATVKDSSFQGEGCTFDISIVLFFLLRDSIPDISHQDNSLVSLSINVIVHISIYDIKGKSCF